MPVVRIVLACFFCSFIGTAQAAEPMKITSPDIRPGGYIPKKFTCQGMDVSPRLEFVDIPEKSASLALVVHDPDTPGGDWAHWIVFNIPPDKFEVAQGEVPGVLGRNDFGREAWGGPCPLFGVHHYFFEGYALDVMLDLEKGASRAQLEKAMEGHVLGRAELIGSYEKI